MRTSKRDRIITGALELAHRDGFDALTLTPWLSTLV